MGRSIYVQSVFSARQNPSSVDRRFDLDQFLLDCRDIGPALPRLHQLR